MCRRFFDHESQARYVDDQVDAPRRLSSTRLRGLGNERTSTKTGNQTVGQVKSSTKPTAVPSPIIEIATSIAITNPAIQAMSESSPRIVQLCDMFTVREATVNDRASIARVYVRSWQVAYRGLIANDYLDQMKAEDRAARFTFESDDASSSTTIVANAGAYGCRWATHDSSANLLTLVSAEDSAKKYENQSSNRLAALDR
jgi:hypothetical protein